MTDARERASAWPLLDGLASPEEPHDERRERLVDAARAADQRIADLERRLAEAGYRADVARFERDRLRRRRAVRLATELASAGRRPPRELASRLRAAATPRAAPPEPTPPAPVDPADEVERRVTEAADLPDPDVHVPPPVRFPHLHVLHVGAVARFASLVSLTPLDTDGWREQLAQRPVDLLLVESTGDDGKLLPPDGLGPVFAAARDAGVPTVRIHLPGGGPEPDVARADHELVEALPGHDGLPVTVDTSRLNPMGWRRQPPNPVAALATRALDAQALDRLAAIDPPVLLLHPPGLRPDGWAGRRRVVRSSEHLHQLLQRVSVLVDLPELHAEPAERLRTWQAARACGVGVVATDPELQLPGLTAVAQGEEAAAAHRFLIDDDHRERHSIVGRRDALLHADREVALREVCAAVGIPLPRAPRTTVLVATHRPEFLSRVADSIQRQAQPDVDVVLALHGEGFDTEICDRFPRCSAVIRIPEVQQLGDVLNAGLDEACGDLIAKMDDDDHYGPHHLTDLVLAQRYSGADVVGKRIEFVYLAARDVTIRRATSGVEAERDHVGGPTILATAERLRRTRFLRLPSRVDSTFYERVLADGGRIYRTHGRDVILERHGQEHAWTLDDRAFLDEAIDQRPGLDVGFAASDPDAT
ncbi:glycosyltransferase [Egicoccus sp. AB-alg2]|uniref:glycosyltransferase n=1 Tax=Egicoccus sp. AB-alg2 TaxID=3242693 RepID=UPI00359DD468